MRTDQLKSPQSCSTPVRPKPNLTDAKDKRASETSLGNHKYTTLKSVKNGKQVAATKSSEQTDRQSPDEEEEKREDEDYEILDTNGEYACEQPGAKVMVNETDSREDLVIPMINEEPGQFWHVTIPPGKRHLIQVLVATPRVALSWKFTTEKKVNTHTTYNLQNSLFFYLKYFLFRGLTQPHVHFIPTLT